MLRIKEANTITVAIINKVLLYNIFFIHSPLFEPEEFHTGNYTEITQLCECLFYKQKNPVRRLFEPEAFHTGTYKK
jgi:hypothetical protein